MRTSILAEVQLDSVRETGTTHRLEEETAYQRPLWQAAELPSLKRLMDNY